jgi:hypothetical protein
MSSFSERIDRLVRHLTADLSVVNAKQGDHVTNFHFEPEEWTEFRKQLPGILRRLREEDLDPQVVSFGALVLEIFKGANIYPLLLKMEGQGNFSHAQRNDSLYALLAGGQRGTQITSAAPIIASILREINRVAQIKGGVLLLTDTELIHPLFRVSAFEQILQGKFACPTVICYPGRRGTIGDNPSFLGIKSSDGNYRSTHIY